MEKERNINEVILEEFKTKNLIGDFGTPLYNTETRYRFIDKNSGEIIDDAQGYGYKTKEKAYKAFNYKKNKPKYDENNNVSKTLISGKERLFKKIMRELEADWFYAMKDGEDVSKIESEKLFYSYWEEFDNDFFDKTSDENKKKIFNYCYYNNK